MAFTERLQTIDRRVAYSAAVIIGLGALAANCAHDPADAEDGRIRSVVENKDHYVEQNETVRVAAGPETFDLQMLNLVEEPAY